MLVSPQAKINIGLHITEKRDDGYHNLETIFYPIPLTDTLEIDILKNSNEPYLFQAVGMPIAGDPHHNLIIKVYESLKADFNIPPLDIYLDKKIPMGAGLGGGSSDAASTMLLLNELFDLQLSTQEMEERVAHIGADCPFFIQNKPAYATGIGNVLSPIELSLKGWVIALVKPQISVSTQEAYAHVRPQVSSFDLKTLVDIPVQEWKQYVKNDFEASVFDFHPQISAIKETLYDMGATYAAMSGSGSTVFGLFKARQSNLKKIFNDCYCFQALIRQ